MRKILAWVLTIILLLSLTACGVDSDNRNESEKPETTAPLPEPTETTAPVPETVTAYVLDKVLVSAEGMEAKILFTYDDQGRILSVEMWNGEELYQNTEMEYRENGEPAVCVTYGPDEKILNKMEYLSVQDGKVNEALVTTNGNTVREVSVRNDAGLLVEKQSYDQDGELIGTTKYEYDAQGNPSKEIALDADGREQQVKEYRCDEDGDLLEYSWRIGEQLIVHYRYTYEDGKMTGRVSETENGLNYQYRYDDRGNMTEVVMGGVPMTFHYRTMELPQEEADDVKEAAESFIYNAFVVT